VNVLLVDDDRELTELMQFVLERAGMATIVAHDGAAAVDLMHRARPDIVVLDVQLGGMDGFEVLEQIRRVSRVPVIMLSGRTSEGDKIRGLDLGADDYLTKPFSHRELVAHIRAKSRRVADAGSAPSSPSPVTAGVLRIDPATHTVTRNGQPVDVSTTEYRLLHYLMSRAGTVVSRSDILRSVWGYDNPSDGDVVRVTVYRLRRKLGTGPNGRDLVRTVAGVGFMIDPGA
jgi:DNA-binding response OmpR family regulator